MKEQVNRTIKINAGIACLDRANEVEPRPNEDSLRDVAIATLYRHCERSEAIPNNQRVFGQGYVFNPVNLVNPINHGSDNMLDCFASLAMTNRDWLRRTHKLGCFAEPVPNKVWGLAMTALFGRFCVFSHSLFRASAHFQFSIFNFQLLKRCTTLLISGFQPFAVYIKLRRVEYILRNLFKNYN